MKSIIIQKGTKLKRANYVRQYIEHLDDANEYIVEIKNYTPDITRTNEQNAYLHTIIGILAQHYRETNKESYAPKAWKLWLKEEHFGYKDIVTPDGVRKELPSTAKLSTKRFKEFVEFIRTFANDNLECYLMTPEEWRQSKYYQ